MVLGDLSHGGAMRACHFQAAVAILFAICFSLSARADSYEWQRVLPSGALGSIYPTLDSACDALYSAATAGTDTTQTCLNGFSKASCNKSPASPDPPTALGQQAAVSVTVAYTNAHPNVCGASPSYSTTSDWTLQSVGTASSACSSKSGQSVAGVVSGGAKAAGTSMCDSGCVVTISSAATNLIGNCPGGTCTIQSGTFSGDSCTPQVDGSDNVNEGTCVNSSSGVLCTEEPKGKNCGTVNGDEVCLTSTAPGQCVSYASGAVACVSKADGTVSSPPAPNSGISGTPATPTAQLTSQSSTTVTNYYNSSVVNVSTSPVITNGQPSSSSSSGSGSSSSSSSGSECSDSVSCTLTTPSTSTGDTIESLGNAFVSGVQASPLYTAVNGLASSFPTGACPSASFSIWGQSYDFMTSACALWSDHVEPVLQTVMMAVYAIGCIWIVLKA